jgi:hypothetical protein
MRGERGVEFKDGIQIKGGNGACLHTVRTSRVPHVGNFVHVGKKLFAGQSSQDMIQNLKTADGSWWPKASFITATVGIRLGTDSPIPPRLAGIPKEVLGMDEFIGLVVKIRRNDEDILKVSVFLVLHELLETTEIVLGISHGSVLNQQCHGVVSTQRELTAGVVGEGNVPNDSHPICEQAKVVVGNGRIVRVQEFIFLDFSRAIVGARVQNAAGTGARYLITGRLPVDSFALLGSKLGRGSVLLDGLLQFLVLVLRQEHFSVVNEASETQQKQNGNGEKRPKDNVESPPTIRANAGPSLGVSKVMKVLQNFNELFAYSRQATLPTNLTDNTMPFAGYTTMRPLSCFLSIIFSLKSLTFLEDGQEGSHLAVG